MYVRLVKTRDSLSLFSGTIDEKTIRMSSVAIRKLPRIVDSGQSYNHGIENTFRESML